MNELTIKNIVNFRTKSDRSKKTFALNLKLEKERKAIDEGGGDYWISSLSAISNAYKLDDIQPIYDKINELKDKYEITEDLRPKVMYKRNLDILHQFETFDLDRLRPSDDMKILKQHKENQILTLKGLPIKVTPNYVFRFLKNDVFVIGAIWFIAQLDGFKKSDLGMFADIMYRYLQTHYSKEHDISPEYCIAVDVFNGYDINYLQLKEKVVPQILIPTIDEINKLT